MGKIAEQNMSIVVFNMLPTSVQSRIPDLQSLRRAKTLSILTSRLRVTQRQKNMDEVMVAHTDDTEVHLKATSSNDADGNLKISSITTIDSGVKWRYVEQGTFLQNSASRETEDLTFARKSYIDSVAYMLKGLPDDMDKHEISIIRRALPKSCVPVGTNAQIEGAPGKPAWLPSSRSKTLLRSTVQGSVAVFVLFTYFILSFLAIIIRTGADFERQYNVSQHVVSNGLVFATAVGKRSGALGEKIYAMSDGKVGKVVSELATWTLEGVAGGVHDGIGQGLLLIEQRQK